MGKKKIFITDVTNENITNLEKAMEEIIKQNKATQISNFLFQIEDFIYKYRSQDKSYSSICKAIYNAMKYKLEVKTVSAYVENKEELRDKINEKLFPCKDENGQRYKENTKKDKRKYIFDKKFYTLDEINEFPFYNKNKKSRYKIKKIGQVEFIFFINKLNECYVKNEKNTLHKYSKEFYEQTLKKEEERFPNHCEQKQDRYRIEKINQEEFMFFMNEPDKYYLKNIDNTYTEVPKEYYELAISTEEVSKQSKDKKIEEAKQN